MLQTKHNRVGTQPTNQCKTCHITIMSAAAQCMCSPVRCSPMLASCIDPGSMWCASRAVEMSSVSGSGIHLGSSRLVALPCLAAAALPEGTPAPACAPLPPHAFCSACRRLRFLLVVPWSSDSPWRSSQPLVMIHGRVFLNLLAALPDPSDQETACSRSP